LSFFKFDFSASKSYAIALQLEEKINIHLMHHRKTASNLHKENLFGLTQSHNICNYCFFEEKHDWKEVVHICLEFRFEERLKLCFG
jgi:ribosomal protein L32